MDDEDYAEADAMHACMDSPTAPPPPIPRSTFDGNLHAVTAQVRIVCNAYGLGELTVPHVPTETATQNAMQTMAGR